MGWTFSPFSAVRFYYLAEEMVRGDRRNERSPLGWSKVILNLPGDKKFHPSLPRVMKWNDLLQRMTGDVKAFVDDLRASGYDEEHAWQVARWLCSRFQYLGLQEAARKRRPPARVTGAWAGTIFSTVEGKIAVSVSKEKWVKARKMVQELLALFPPDITLDSSPEKYPDLSYKRLEQVRGFWCHISMTYPIFTCYLKGMHLLLASHWPGRDEDGWKIPDNQYVAFLYKKYEKGNLSEDELHSLLNSTDQGTIATPTKVKATSILLSDLKALEILLAVEEPPQAVHRTTEVISLYYGFLWTLQGLDWDLLFCQKMASVIGWALGAVAR